MSSVDRKIRCGMQMPGCTNCSRAGRSCAGYGIRLSWPESRGRRALFNASPPRRDDVGGGTSYGSLRFVNVTAQDTRLSYELLASKTSEHGTGYTLSVRKNIGVKQWSQCDDTSPPLPPHLSWNMINEQETSLLDYCQPLLLKIADAMLSRISHISSQDLSS